MAPDPDKVDEFNEWMLTKFVKYFWPITILTVSVIVGVPLLCHS